MQNNLLATPPAIVAPAPVVPAIVAPAAATVTVASLLNEACIASGTMYDKAREAAKLAASELDPKILSVAERVNKVVTGHAAHYGKNQNVRAIFSDALWLLAVPEAKVETQIKGEDKPKIFDAEDVIDLPKHQMKDAAKQVREQVGAGRASSKKPAQAATPAAPAAATPAAAPVNTFFDDLAIKVADAGEFAKIVAVLELAGYVVSKKGKAVKSAAKTEAAPVPTIAAQLESKILAATK